ATYQADEHLINIANEAIQTIDVNVLTGLIATGDSFMADAERVAFIRDLFTDMLAAEMEAAAIAQLCYQYDTTFVVIRAMCYRSVKKSSTTYLTFYLTAYL